MRCNSVFSLTAFGHYEERSRWLVKLIHGYNTTCKLQLHGWLILIEFSSIVVYIKIWTTLLAIVGILLLLKDSWP